MERAHEERETGEEMSAQPAVRAQISPDGFSVKVSEASSGVVRFQLFHEDLRFPGSGSGTVIWSVAVSPDEKYLATGGRDTSARLWSSDTGGLLLILIGQADYGGYGGDPRFPKHYGYVWSVAFSPDGTRLATGGLDGHVRLWQVPSGEQIACFAIGTSGSLQNPPGVVVKFSADGRAVEARDASAGHREWPVPTS
jgi:WD40 repeat protein